MNLKHVIILLLIYGLDVFSFNYPILSYEKYATIAHPSPYTFQLCKTKQYLFYFGANHSCDSKDKQYPLLESLWQDFLLQTGGENSVVLVEGSKRGVASSKQKAIIDEGGEGGLITLLAYENGIEVECPEPDKNFLISELLKQFSQDEVTYYIFTHSVMQFNRVKIVDKNLQFEPFYQRYKYPVTFDQIKKIHFDLFKKTFDPHDEKFFYTITNPVVDVTIINKVARQASIIRDQYIVDHINTLMQKGKNIFVVYGRTHAVMQELAIRDLWERFIDI